MRKGLLMLLALILTLTFSMGMFTACGTTPPDNGGIETPGEVPGETPSENPGDTSGEESGGEDGGFKGNPPGNPEKEDTFEAN